MDKRGYDEVPEHIVDVYRALGIDSEDDRRAILRLIELADLQSTRQPAYYAYTLSGSTEPLPYHPQP